VEERTFSLFGRDQYYCQALGNRATTPATFVTLAVRRVGSGNRLTLTHMGEQWPDRWMAQHARVCWVEHPQPWELEDALLRQIALPLDLQGNKHHPFHAKLTARRQAAKAAARELPVAAEGNQQRVMLGQ